MIVEDEALGENMPEKEKPEADRIARLEQASLDSAHEGLKALLLLNGGACVAILGFLATTLKDAKAGGFEPLVAAMLRSLTFFAVGAGLSVLTAVLSYLANQAYAGHLIDPKNGWGRGDFLTATGVGLAVLSLFFFACGVHAISVAVPF